MFAIIECGGKQFKVKEGDVIDVEKLDKNPGDKIEIDSVLFLGDGDSSKAGEDVKKSKVTAELLADTNGPKVVIYKYKRRKDYNKKTGHRQKYSKIKITKISVA